MDECMDLLPITYYLKLRGGRTKDEGRTYGARRQGNISKDLLKEELLFIELY